MQDKAKNESMYKNKSTANSDNGNLSKEYLGVLNGSMISNRPKSNGYFMAWWNSFRLVIEKIDEETGKVEGLITETNLRKEGRTPEGKEIDLKSMTPDCPIYGWGKELLIRNSTFTGNFFKDNDLLNIDSIRISEAAGGVEKEE